MFSKEALVEAVWVDVEGVRFCFVNDFGINLGHLYTRMAHEL